MWILIGVLVFVVWTVVKMFHAGVLAPFQILVLAFVAQCLWGPLIRFLRRPKGSVHEHYNSSEVMQPNGKPPLTWGVDEEPEESPFRNC